MLESANMQALLQQHFEHYSRLHKVDGHRLKVCRHLLSCHTPALGGVQYQCDHCDRQVPHYHSCRDRHCPQCQQRASRRWCERQQQAILPVSYHHLVFTLPHELNAWVQLHPEVIYPRLFQTVWKTLKTFAADPKRLNGKLGMTAVLHTWGQNLSQHVHLHCLIPAGALGAEQQWHPAKSTYLFPVRALSRHYRGSMVSALRQSVKSGQLKRIHREVDHTLDQLMQKEWVVYSKSCLNKAENILGYLARYSHRIAISDQRIIRFDENQIAFRYKDYRNNRSGIMQLDCEEFIRRFMMHVLPQGLMRIRHYGFLANRCRKASLNQIRKILQQPAKASHQETNEDSSDEQPRYRCPLCKKGHLIAIRRLDPVVSRQVLAPG